jgi:hypothetical protein
METCSRFPEKTSVFPAEGLAVRIIFYFNELKKSFNSEQHFSFFFYFPEKTSVFPAKKLGQFSAQRAPFGLVII